MKTDSEIIVVGAGMVGLAMAVALGNAGFTVKVLEAGELAADRPDTLGLRVSAIAHASRRLLCDMGAWQHLPQNKVHSYTGMRIWDASVEPFSDRALAFHSADLGELDLGCIVENQWLRWALLQVVAQNSQITVMPSVAVEDLEIGGQGVRVFGGDGSQHRTHLVIGADGPGSRVRTLSAIATRGKSYQQRAIVCHVSTGESHDDTAWQRFLQSGPLAFLPLGRQRCSIVWTTTETQAAQLLSLDDQAFEVELATAADGVLGALQVVSERASFPLSMQHASHYVTAGVALIGDAAHVVHPLAGQGANLGFGDVAALLQALLAGRRRGDACGDLWALRAYERERKYENQKMMLTLESLHRLFGAPQPWLRGSRALGMGLIDNSSLLKQFLVRRALGKSNHPGVSVRD